MFWIFSIRLGKYHNLNIAYKLQIYQYFEFRISSPKIAFYITTQQHTRHVCQIISGTYYPCYAFGIEFGLFLCYPFQESRHLSLSTHTMGGVDIESQHCNCNTYYFIQWSARYINLTVCSILKRCVQTPVSSRPLHRENILSKYNVLPAQHYASPHQILKKSNRLKWGCKINDKTEQKWDYPLQWRHNGWGLWNLKSPASRLFAHPLIQTQIEENIKAPRRWPLSGNSPVTCEFPAQMASNAENNFNLMISSC